jgi:16S rRNA (guanine(966)-N(2))-methyltransferase RsmD
MRVIAGSCKGQRLQAPRSAHTRPTSDRVKTIIFDILGEKTRHALTLDLFAGSGSLGIEALSRGAGAVDFVESDKDAGLVIRKNLQATHLDNHARVIIHDAFLFLEKPAAPGAKYNLVLADPPYEQGWGENILRALSNHEWLANGAWVLIEESARAQKIDAPQRFQLHKSRIVGETALYFFEAR